MLTWEYKGEGLKISSRERSFSEDLEGFSYQGGNAMALQKQASKEAS